MEICLMMVGLEFSCEQNNILQALASQQAKCLGRLANTASLLMSDIHSQ